MVNTGKKTITVSQTTGITVSVTLLIMFAGAVFTTATWIADIRNNVSDLQIVTERNRQDVASLKNENTSTQVKFTEIQTQLKGIDATLLEIKQSINREK